MKMGSVERVPIEIPGVQVVGEFPIKRFMEIIYNAAAKQHGAKLTATVRPSTGNERTAEPKTTVRIIPPARSEQAVERRRET